MRGFHPVIMVMKKTRREKIHIVSHKKSTNLKTELDRKYGFNGSLYVLSLLYKLM